MEYISRYEEEFLLCHSWFNDPALSLAVQVRSLDQHSGKGSCVAAAVALVAAVAQIGCLAWELICARGRAKKDEQGEKKKDAKINPIME